MKKIIFFIAILFFVRNVFAQISTLAIMQGKKGNVDTALINQFKRDAEPYRTTNFQKMMQYTDTIIALAKTQQKPEILADALFYKGNFLRQKDQFKEANLLFNQAMQLVKNCHSVYCRKLISNIYKSKGTIYQVGSDFNNALDMILKSLDIDQELTDTQNIIINENSIGNIYMAINNLPVALQHYQKIKQLLESNDAVLLQTKEYQYPYAYAGSILNIGTIYSKQQKLQEALDAYHQVIQLAQKYSLPGRITAFTHNRLADVQLGLKNNELAWDHLAKAVEFHTKRNLQLELCQDYNIKANIINNASPSFLQKIGIAETNKTDTVLQLLQKSLAIAEKFNSQTDLAETLQSIASLYEKSGDYSNAYRYQRRFIVINDSLRNADLKNNLMKKDFEYFYTKKEDSLRFEQSIQEMKWLDQVNATKKNALIATREKELQHLSYLKAQSDLRSANFLNASNQSEIALQQKEMELQTQKLNLVSSQKDNKIKQYEQEAEILKLNKRNNILFLGILSSGVLILTGFIYMLQRNAKTRERILKQEQELSLAKQRENIIADIHDDVGSTISTIRINSELLQTALKLPQGEILAHKIASNSNLLAQQMNTLVWSLNNQNDTMENFTEYVKQHSIQFFENTGIEFEFIENKGIQKMLPVKSVWRKNLYLAIKEIMNNILKHSKATKAKLTVTVHGAGIEIEIADNGIGLNKANPFGNGLKNISKRIADLNGKISIINNKGTHITILCPIV